MDTSEKYIRMCEQAQEIQDLDFIRDENSFFSEEESFERGGYQVWLPRQDQLQEMISIENMGKLMIPLTTFNSFNYFVMSDWTLFESLECYWLAFVMKEKYNKTWNEEQQNWIKIN